MAQMGQAAPRAITLGRGSHESNNKKAIYRHRPSPEPPADQRLVVVALEPFLDVEVEAGQPVISLPRFIGKGRQSALDSTE
jgi:hypothetical protein